MRPELPSLDELLSDAHRVAVLEGITNFTNIGAIFRSAAALGVDAVLVTPGCHDPLYKRASRVSMGTVFQVPWGRVDSVEKLRAHGFVTAALALEPDAVALDDPALKRIDKLALVLGSEGYGLDGATIEACDLSVIIPMEHEVDSLNVARRKCRGLLGAACTSLGSCPIVGHVSRLAHVGDILWACLRGHRRHASSVPVP